jgi:hypothetical protein
MHIEGNVAKSFVRHVYGEREGSKADSWACRRACEAFQVHYYTWVQTRPEGVQYIEPAPWVMTKDERRQFKNRIAKMRMPTGYGANLRKAFTCGRDQDWAGYLKTHDYHKLLHDIFPIALDGLCSHALRTAMSRLATLLRYV